MKISVITVCMNRVNTIEKAIQSVINQACNELEYIIIDGGSTDGTVDIIKKYEKYFTYWVSEADEGIYDAMNKGIAKSTGEIVAFLNSDDWYEENALVTVNSYFEKCDPMILTGRVNMLQKGKWTKYTGILENNKENIRMEMIYRQPATFVRREVFDTLGGFNTRYKISADFEWMLRVYDSGMEIMHVEDVFTNFSSTGISNTNTGLTIRESREVALEALEKCERYSRQEKEKWRTKINRYYDEKQARMDIRRIIRTQQLSDYLELKSLVLSYFTEQSYVVWGIGIIGEDMYSLLTQLGLEVDFFVDKKADGIDLLFHNREVLAPQKLICGKKVIIAALECEDEIVYQLNGMGLHKDKDFILYSTILPKLVETYEQYYMNIEE